MPGPLEAFGNAKMKMPPELATALVCMCITMPLLIRLAATAAGWPAKPAGLHEVATDTLGCAAEARIIAAVATPIGTEYMTKFAY